MKKNLLWFFGLALVAAATFTTACNDDPCKDVKCGDNGDCFDGACVCNQGYEGTNCDVTWANKFAGTWNASEVCNGTSGTNLTVTYTATISETSAEKITVKNLGGFGLASEVSFDLTDASSVSFAGTDTGGRKFTGTATYANGTITYSYKVTYTDLTTDDCAGTMTK